MTLQYDDHVSTVRSSCWRTRIAQSPHPVKDVLGKTERALVCDPPPYAAMARLLVRTFLVLSDAREFQEEAPTFDVPGACCCALAPSRNRAQGDCWPTSPSLGIGSRKGLLTVEPGGLVGPTRQTASRCVLEPPCTAEPPMHEGQEESCDTGLTPAWPYLHGVFGPNETTRPSRRIIRDREHPGRRRSSSSQPPCRTKCREGSRGGVGARLDEDTSVIGPL